MRTQVTTVYDEHGTNLRLLFGNPVESKALVKKKDYVKSVYSFEPGQIFGLDFRANCEGRSLRIMICRAAQGQERMTSLRMVHPGVVVLFDVTGRIRSRVALALFRKIGQTRNLANLTDGEFEYLSMRIQRGR